MALMFDQVKCSAMGSPTGAGGGAGAGAASTTGMGGLGVATGSAGAPTQPRASSQPAAITR
jgi:hypothetical protein